MSDAKLQMNRFVEDLEEGMVSGQNEPVPVAGRDYLLQTIVSLEYVTENPNTLKKRFTIKRSGELKLIRIPAANELPLNGDTNKE